MTLPMDLDPSLDSTRRSWNAATKNHNAHKGDQAAFLRGGGEVLFPEERALLGPLKGRSLVHLQCNSGQDSLCLARRGAQVTGVDFSQEAVAFARKLSADTGLAAQFVEAEVVGWMHQTPERFELAFASYGVVGWSADAAAWFRGVERVLQHGGRFVYVEFHPLLWSYGADRGFTGDDYFTRGPFTEPVGDYVAESQGLLGGPAQAAPSGNDVPAYSYQYTLGELVSFAAAAGLVVESLAEYPYSNGFKAHPALVAGEGRRWEWPEGKRRAPLMFSLVARKA